MFDEESHMLGWKLGALRGEAQEEVTERKGISGLH